MRTLVLAALFVLVLLATPSFANTLVIEDCTYVVNTSSGSKVVERIDYRARLDVGDGVSTVFHGSIPWNDKRNFPTRDFIVDEIKKHRPARVEQYRQDDVVGATGFSVEIE